MNIFNVLYNLFIGPLEIFFEILFSLANKVIDNPGLSIIFLSLAMNFLVLPLYKRADAMQEEEREVEKKMNHWVTHIKKSFKGDERFMMLQTYYRQNNYKPTDILKGSVSLFLEIPFFMAAYNFLSSLDLLNHVSFGPISNLGAPDGLLTIAGITINLLPILMTLINMVSTVIYTKGLPLKSKIQLYGMAIIFLVLLYDSPSGLVFYWTLNNIFSLVKIVFYKFKDPKLVLSVLSSIVGVIGLVYITFINPFTTMRRQVLISILLLMLFAPLVLYYIKKKFVKVEIKEISKKENAIFYLGIIFMTILCGLLIPSAVIAASPEEFINTMTLQNPLLYIANCFVLAAGTFIIWFNIFYALASASGKRTMGFGMLALSGMAIVNYMFFGKGYGNLSPNLTFDSKPVVLLKDQFVNLGIIILVIALLYFIWKKKEDVVKAIYAAAIIAVVCMGGMNVVNVNAAVSDKIDNLNKLQAKAASIPLSKNGKNVVVLMLDRAIGGLVPYLLNEDANLKNQFDGFTYYPNTISYGGYTNVGTPGIYGGYEYTPKNMNKRDQESLKDKQNEALKVMPVLFDKNDFTTTVFDPTYAGYGWIPDLSIYDEYPRIHKFITMENFYAKQNNTLAKEDSFLKLNRNLFVYSLFKVSPLVVQPNIYDSGNYNGTAERFNKVATKQTLFGISKSKGVTSRFTTAYSVLQNLTHMTKISDSNKGTFLMMSNNTTHEPILLQEPEYITSFDVDNTQYDKEHKDRFNLDGKVLHMENEKQVTHYHVNMAAFKQLGKWFDYLKENDVYDNTRIIIVSDHGQHLKHFDNFQFEDGKPYGDVEKFNALFMVKDFNSKGFKTDTSFMTNADVPGIAVDGIIKNAVNPFTKNPLKNDSAKKGKQHILFTEWSVTKNHGNTFLPGKWITVHDDIFNMNNWEVLEDSE